MGMKIALKWPNHANAVATGLFHLFKEEFKTDFELSINGCYIKAHQIILSIFCSQVKSQEKSTLILGEHSSMSKEDVQMLLDFIYTGQIDVEEKKLVSLRELCRLMGFKELFDIISNFLKSKGESQSPTIRYSKGELRSPMVRTSKRIRQPVSYVNYEGETSQDSVKIPEPQSEKSTKSCTVGEVDDGANSESGLSSKAVKKSGCINYTCQHCSFKTKLRHNMLMHMINKHRLNLQGNPITKNLKCPQCSKLFYTNQHIKSHIVKVHGEKRFVCDLCGKRFVSKSNLDVHNRGMHSNVKPFMCETCGQRFKHPHHLREHNHTHLATMVNCEVCGESLRQSYLPKHMKVKHSSDPKPHQCTLCSFGTWKNWNLKIHLKNVHKIHFVDADNPVTYEKYEEDYAK